MNNSDLNSLKYILFSDGDFYDLSEFEDFKTKILKKSGFIRRIIPIWDFYITEIEKLSYETYIIWFKEHYKKIYNDFFQLHNNIGQVFLKYFEESEKIYTSSEIKKIFIDNKICSLYEGFGGIK